MIATVTSVMGSRLGGQTVNIVVCATDIPAGTTLTREMVRLDMVAKDSVLSDASTALSEVIGKKVRIPMFEGEQVVMRKLGAQSLPSGMVRMMIPLSPGKSPVSSIREGDLVDVIFVSNPGSGYQIAKLILGSLKVIEIPAHETRTTFERQPSIVVAVSAEQAELLAFCMEHGSLYITITDSTAKNRTDGVTFSTVLAWVEP
ncbi:MAG: Flp pilus assembly protein CpaB [Bacillota bacterium]